MQSVQEQLSIVSAIAARHRGHVTVSTSDAERCAELWAMRKSALWSAMSAYPDREAMITDVCVPLSELPVLMHETKVAIAALSPPLPCPIVAHAGDGNFHVFIMFRPHDADESAAAKRLAHDMAMRAIELGGTCTGEHGIGSGKMDLLVTEMGSGSLCTMRMVKKALDPHSIMNPGKVFLPRDIVPHHNGNGNGSGNNSHGNHHH